MPLPEWARPPGLEWQHDDNYSALEVVWRNPRDGSTWVQHPPLPVVAEPELVGYTVGDSVDARCPFGQRRPILAGMIGGAIAAGILGALDLVVHLLWR